MLIGETIKMSTVSWINHDSWEKEVYHQKCKCGHELYIHAFTMGRFDDTGVELRTSQCTTCKYNETTEKFECEGFVRDL